MMIYTKKDFKIDTFRAGGKGGQRQNKVETGVRITHIESGISAESRIHASQLQNRKAAFIKLAERMKPWILEQFGISKPSINTEVVRTYNVKRNIVKNTNGVTKVNYDTLIEKGDGLRALIEERKSFLT